MCVDRTYVYGWEYVGVSLISMALKLKGNK
jgi:hypothetical protein